MSSFLLAHPNTFSHPNVSQQGSLGLPGGYCEQKQLTVTWSVGGCGWEVKGRGGGVQGFACEEEKRDFEDLREAWESWCVTQEGFGYLVLNC